MIPNPCPLLSPELVYTALTRQRTRTILLVQGDANDLRLLASPAQSETARRLTYLFRPPDPFQTPEGLVLDGSHVHRTAEGHMVRSKSEVIVANTLTYLGVKYDYEKALVMQDGSSSRPGTRSRSAPSRRRAARSTTPTWSGRLSGRPGSC